MGVSYHLVPVEKETGQFKSMFSTFGRNITNEINILGSFLIQFSDRFLNYFEKDREYYDFVFSLSKHEISEDIFDPEIIKTKLIETRETLKIKNNFPINQFYGFKYDDNWESPGIYITLLGEELNKIIVDGEYQNDGLYDINTIFDIFNGYNELYQKEFYRYPPIVYINDNNNERTTKLLNLSAFPTKIRIEKSSYNFGLDRDLKDVSLILITPYEYFEKEIANLIDICEECTKHNLGIRSYVCY